MRPPFHLLMLSICLVFCSCNKNSKNEVIGPAICPSDNFRIISFTVSDDEIDYSTTDYETIEAQFNEEVTWTIKLTGEKSGATKTYKGRSDQISLKWYGQTSDPYTFFQSGENVSVTLILSCRNETTSKSIHILKANTFNKQTDAYLLVSDFDGSGSVPNQVKMPGYIKGIWCSYPEDEGVLTSLYIHPSNEVLAAPQGSNYLTLTALAQPANWFSGGVYAELPGNFSMSAIDNAYLNAFISSGNNTTTLVGVVIIVDMIKYMYRLPVNWRGWKMVSLKLKDFKNEQGHSLKQLTTETVLDFGLNCSSKQGQATEVNLDFIVITKEGSFFE